MQQPGGLPGSDVADDATHRAVSLSARVLAPRATSASASAAVGASAISRTIGSVPDGRTCSQRSRQESRSPSRSSASASGNAARSRSYSGRSSGPRGPFAFTMVYRGDAATSCGHRNPSRGKEMQDQGHPQGRIAPDVQRRQHDAAVAFAADHGALVSHGPGHVRLTHRRPDEPRAPRPAPHPPPPGWSTGSPPRSGSAAVSAASVQHRPDREGQRVVLADRPPGLVHQRQPVHVRIDRHPDVGTASPAPARPSSPRFSGIGSGARGNRPSGSRLIPLTRQPSRSSSGGMATPPAPRTQSSATWKSRGANRGDVDHRQREDRVEVPRDRLAILAHLAEPVPARLAAGPARPAPAPRRPPRRRGRCRRARRT